MSNGTSNLDPWFIIGFTLQRENSISKKTSIVVWGTNLTSNVGLLAADAAKPPNILKLFLIILNYLIILKVLFTEFCYLTVE